MTTAPRTILETETAFFMSCLRELAAAERSGDPVRLYNALDEIDAFALHTPILRLEVRAKAELKRHGFDINQRPDGMEPARDKATDEAKLSEAVAILRRAGELPSNCMVTLGADGAPQIREF